MNPIASRTEYKRNDRGIEQESYSWNNKIDSAFT